ncbi:cell cycle and apoptosis regulator protein 2-like [Oncorhynchus clarkii lewisi]|uniref:cell cycle and apoptosis regulator protein 2-like n=1 Tax=Oncorhynchus clarkii lewisi TaxID=490388 RepID=UPI0039B955B1
MDSQMKQRVFTGVVTQLQEHYGMVDQEVRFQKSVVKGRVPALGERVLVKAVLDLSQSHSWSAQRVQTLAEHTQTAKFPRPLLPSMMPAHAQKPGILGSKPQPLLKSPKIPPLIPSILHTVAKPGLLQTPSWGGQFEGWGRGIRKRPAEAGRRGDRREDSGVRGCDQKRRRWKEEEDKGAHPKKTSPTPVQSPALFSCFPRDCVSCDSLELQRRYPHLPLPPSVCHLSISWIDSFPPSQPLPFPLPQPCLYHIGPVEPDQHIHTEREGAECTVKVLLLSMASSEELYRQCCGLQDRKEQQEGAMHPASLIKFLLGEVGGEFRALGGPWCLETDGGGPSPLKDPRALLRTALRCVREQSGLDLSGCSQWYKMAELSYVCEGKLETVVFLLPDVWRIVPTEDDWSTLRTQEEEGAPLPAAPCLVARPRPGLALCPVPLSSLLEPHTSTTKEAFEVGLLAELFCEMLQRDFGLLLYRCLCSLTPTHTPTEDNQIKNDKKQRIRDERSKRFQERGESGGTAAEETDDDGEEMDEKEGEGEREMLGEEGITSENSDCLLKHNVLSRRVLLACVFFDKRLTGGLRQADLHNILLSLGLWLTPTQVQVLLNKVCVEGQCPYRMLASRWEETEHTEPDISMEGNRGLFRGATKKEKACGRKSGGSRGPAAAVGAEVVSYKGSVVNIPSLLQALEAADRTRKALELRIATLQDALVDAAAVTQGQEEGLSSRLEKVELRSSSYEKKLKEDAGHMFALIHKMQEMVDETTSLTQSKTANEEH